MNLETMAPPVAELLPHGAEALCVDALAEHHRRERTVARLLVRPGLALHDPVIGGIPAWAGIEIMAQTAGIFLGMEGRESGEAARVGYLIGVRHFRAPRPVFEDGLELLIEARRRYCEANGFGCFLCRISSAGETLASATLSVWRPPVNGGDAEPPAP